MSNKKTNGVGRKDKEACEWTFLSAMIFFQDRAKQLGGGCGDQHRELLSEEHDQERDPNTNAVAGA